MNISFKEDSSHYIRVDKFQFKHYIYMTLIIIRHYSSSTSFNNNKNVSDSLLHYISSQYSDMITSYSYNFRTLELSLTLIEVLAVVTL